MTEAAPVVHEILSSPAKGQVIPLEQVNDEVFSKKMMGNGFAITEHDGHIYAPIDGEITSIFPTKHALIITTLAGTGILIHLGLDTVELEGAPFDIKVTEQQKIKHGDLLAVMDLKQIQEAQKDATVIVITPDDQSGQLLKQDVAVDVTDEVFER
ncbi:PTS glucose transporter subunit IIA [Loigolactobacillus zhaoyuanensis]|uniref:PTS glucose transporter subunit IIA n=1 Tax=Loigolactobacillus zhaoyuanensis TaxID=2486017 RepID=A0ABW8UED1_9LACO